MALYFALFFSYNGRYLLVRSGGFAFNLYPFGSGRRDIADVMSAKSSNTALLC